MPVELFIEQKADDGTVTYVKADELPEDIVKSHAEYQRVDKLYKDAVAESKQRLTRAQQAEAKLKETNPEAEEKPVTPTVKDEKPQLDEDALYKKFAEKFRQEQASEALAAKQADLEVENLIKQHRLQGVDNIRETLTLAGANKSALAETLGRSLKSFAPIDGGEVDVDSPDFMKGVYERLNLPK